ncbi:hypothetical protein N2152v2_000858 [Parachlorella kessleri]
MDCPAPPYAALKIEKGDDEGNLFEAISFITGGISNALYKVAPKADAGLAPVAFRIYGDNTENFIDRKKEVELMQLLQCHGFGPQLLGVFDTGRIEEFLKMRALSHEEMASPQYAPIVARTLRRFHSVQPQGKQEVRTPFARIYEWLDTAKEFRFEDPKKQEEFEAFDLQRLRREVLRVERVCQRSKSPVVLAHNDLLCGNIMVPDQRGAGFEGPANGTCSSDGSSSSSGGGQEMTFIDFEYSEWAPRGFDIGNHFVEYGGYDCVSSLYPSQEQAERFLRHYLAGDSCGPDEVDAAELARCVAEVNAFALASNMFWGTWCFLQASTDGAKWSSIDFDYLQYAQLKWGEYFKRRDAFLAAAEEAFLE